MLQKLQQNITKPHWPAEHGRGEGGERGGEEEGGRHVEGGVVVVRGVVHGARQRRAHDGGRAAEQDQQPERVGQLVQAQQVHQDDGRQGDVAGWEL